jgi:hypothetical protein
MAGERRGDEEAILADFPVWHFSRKELHCACQHDQNAYDSYNSFARHIVAVLM